MWCGTMPHVRKVVEGFSVNSRMSQYFISEAFRIARFNVQHLSIVISCFPCPAGGVRLQIQVDKNVRKGAPENVFLETQCLLKSTKHSSLSLQLQDRYTLVGYQGSRIFWEGSNDTWVVSGIFGKTDQRLTLRRAKTTYPFGLEVWRTDQVKMCTWLYHTHSCNVF